MPLIQQVVANLITCPRPVLCLDTCDLLNLIECAAELEPLRLHWANAIVAAATTTPPAIMPVITFLVANEFRQNVDAIVSRAEEYIVKLDQQLAQLNLAANLAGANFASSPKHHSLGIPAALRNSSESLLQASTLLDQDRDCMARAVERVLTKTRPSHRGQLKDSIHLEHYLEFARQARAAGLADPIAIVSSNSSDFWEAKNKSDVHPELRPELSAVSVDFRGSLEAACGLLGI